MTKTSARLTMLAWLKWGFLAGAGACLVADVWAEMSRPSTQTYQAIQQITSNLTPGGDVAPGC